MAQKADQLLANPRIGSLQPLADSSATTLSTKLIRYLTSNEDHWWFTKIGEEHVSDEYGDKHYSAEEQFAQAGSIVEAFLRAPTTGLTVVDGVAVWDHAPGGMVSRIARNSSAFGDFAEQVKQRIGSALSDHFRNIPKEQRDLTKAREARLEFGLGLKWDIGGPGLLLRTIGSIQGWEVFLKAFRTVNGIDYEIDLEFTLYDVFGSNADDCSGEGDPDNRLDGGELKDFVSGGALAAQWQLQHLSDKTRPFVQRIRIPISFQGDLPEYALIAPNSVVSTPGANTFAIDATTEDRVFHLSTTGTGSSVSVLDVFGNPVASGERRSGFGGQFDGMSTAWLAKAGHEYHLQVANVSNFEVSAAGLSSPNVVLDTSSYMLGKVFVNVVLVESEGASEPHWTPQEIAAVKAAISHAGSFWSDARTAFSGKNDLQFTYGYGFADSPVRVPRQISSLSADDFGLLIDPLRNRLGMNISSDDRDSDRLRDISAFNDSARTANSTDWATTVFIVKGALLDGPASWAEQGGPWLVLTGDAVTKPELAAHELGHVFGALDEYAGSDQFNDRSGYLNARNTNAADGNSNPSSQVASIMLNPLAAWQQRLVSPSAMAMVGWRDSDSDHVDDILDVPLQLLGGGFFRVSTGTYEFHAESFVVARGNHSASSLRGPSVTLNTVDQLQVRINGGAWQDVANYGTSHADISFTRGGFAPGAYDIQFRTRDQSTGVTSNVVSDSFVVNGGLILEIDQSLISEYGGAATATVRRSTTMGSLVVSFDISDPSEVSVPATLTIPDGQASISFAINAVDDLLLDGTQGTFIVASAPGYTAGVASLHVTDYESLIAYFDRDAIRESGNNRATLWVQRSNIDEVGISPLTISFRSSDRGDATVQSWVEMPDTYVAAGVYVYAVNDSQLDGLQSVTFEVNAEGFVGTSVVLKIIDDDSPRIVLGGSTTYRENDPPRAIVSSASIIDPDSANFDGGLLRAAITNNAKPADRLDLQHRGWGSGRVGIHENRVYYEGVQIGTYVTGNSTRPLQVTFNGSTTLVAAQAVLRSISFRTVTEHPSVLPRTIQFRLIDGSGGTSNLAVKKVNVVAVNDSPIISRFGHHSVFYEGDPPRRLFPQITIADPDSSSFSGGWLTVRVVARGQATDRLFFQTGGGFSVSGNELRHLGAMIGRISGGSGIEPLVIVFYSGATREMVQSILGNIMFSNPSERPASRRRDIEAQVYDGDGGVSNIATATVGVQSVNDVPILSGIGGSVGYVRNSSAVFLARSATVSDVDNPNFGGGKLLVEITNGSAPSNRLLLSGLFTFSGNYVVYNGTTTIGTRNPNAGVGTTKLEVTLNANATRTIVQQLVRAIRFSTVGATTTAPRVVEFALMDGDGGVSNKATKTVNVT